VADKDTQTPPEIKSVLEALAGQEKTILALINERDEASASERKSLNEKIAAADAALEKVREDYKGLVEKYEGDGAELKSARERLDDIERRLGRPGFGGSEPVERKSFGQMFVDMLQKSGEIERMRSTGSRDSAPLQINKAVEEIMDQYRKSVERKATLTTAAATDFGGTFRDMTVDRLKRPTVIRNLMNVQQTSQNAVEYIEILGFGPDTNTGTVSSIAESSGTATATTGAAHGLSIGDVVLFSGVTPAAYNNVFFVHTVPSTTTFTFKVASGTGAGSGTMLWYDMNRGAAAMVAEANAKPEARLNAELKTANIRTMAHWLPASRQVLDDVPQIRGIIDNELLYGLDDRLDSQLLYGDATGQNLQGILTHSGRQRYDGSSDIYSLDAIRKGITRVGLAKGRASLAIVNDLDWERMELTKPSGGNGHYVLAGGAAGSDMRLWRIPVLATPRIALNTALVGDFNIGGTLYDRESSVIRFSDSHASYFTYNILAILAEMRVGVAWKRPGMFCEVTLPAAA